MCHKSVGLVQNIVEARGIATISITVRPEITWGVGVPRAAYVRFPTGAPLGEPGQNWQHRTILKGVLDVLAEAEEPRTMVELPYRWRRMKPEEGDE